MTAIFDTESMPFEVWAYGSRVNGDAHEGSDLDLVVRMPDLQKMPNEVYTGLKNKIRECNVPIVVQLLDWARLPDGFHKNILSKYELLYSNLEKFAREVTGHQREDCLSRSE